METLDEIFITLFSSLWVIGGILLLSIPVGLILHSLVLLFL